MLGSIITVNPEKLSIYSPEFRKDIHAPHSKRRTEIHQLFSQKLGFDGDLIPWQTSFSLFLKERAKARIIRHSMTIYIDVGESR